MNLFLHSLQSPINIGMILRVAETFNFTVLVYDHYHIFDDPSKIKTISDFSAGALERRPLTEDSKLRSPNDCFVRPGRVIATCLSKDSFVLSDFVWDDLDIIALGNEYDGLPDEFITHSNALLRIALPSGYLPKARSYSPIDTDRVDPVSQNGIPNLNVAMTAGIICYAGYISTIVRP